MLNIQILATQQGRQTRQLLSKTSTTDAGADAAAVTMMTEQLLITDSLSCPRSCFRHMKHTSSNLIKPKT